MSSLLSASENFQSPAAKYERYNFHRHDERTRMLEALRSPKPRIITLEGLDEENHLLLIESACYQASRQGQPWECVRVSFEDYNPDVGTAESFLNDQLSRREVRGEKVEKLREVLSGLALGLKAELDISTAFAVSIAVSGGLRFTELLEAAAPTFEPVRGYPSPGPERLRALIDILTAKSAVVLYLPGSYPLPDPLRRWLLNICKHTDRLLLAFANVGVDSAGEVTIGVAVREHFVLAPLTHAELAAGVDAQFGPNLFPPDFYDALLLQSKGVPWRLAEVMKRLMNAGAVEGGGSQPWMLQEPVGSSSAVLSQFVSTFQEPVDQLLESRDPWDTATAEFIYLSALFHDRIPAGLLSSHLGIEPGAADALIENVLVRFGPNSRSPLLSDAGVHVDIPGERVLRFLNQIGRAVLLDTFSNADREAAARELLDTLDEVRPQITPSIARLYYELSQHLDAQERGWFRDELRWWVGREEANDLRAYISEAAREGLYSVDTLFSVIDSVVHAWPPYRLEAIMGGLEDSGVGVPLELLRGYHSLRANICFALDQFDKGEQHARAGLEATPAHDSDGRMQFLALLWHAATKIGDYRTALTHAEAAVQIARRSRSLSISAVWAWGHLGLTLADLGRHSEAEEAARELIRIAGKGLDPEGTDISRAYLDAAHIYSSIGKPAIALPYITNSLSIRRAHYGPASAADPSTLDLLAGIQAQLGNWTEAKRDSDSAVAVATAVFGPEHSRTAQAYYTAAQVRLALKEFDAAAPLLLQAMAIHRKEFGPNHVGVARALHGLVACYEIRDPRQAEGYLDELVELYTHRRELGWSRSVGDVIRLVTLIEKSGNLPRAADRGEELLARMRTEADDGAERDTEALEQLIAAYRYRLHPTESAPPGLTDAADRHTRVPESLPQPGEQTVEPAADDRGLHLGWLARIRSVFSRKRDRD